MATSATRRLNLSALSALLLLSGAGNALAAGDATSGDCANSATPGFRTYLPDCRAYELVTPPYKAGYFIAAEGLTINEAGTELLGDSLGNFDGETPRTLAYLRPYRMSRASSGWSTTALLTNTGPLQRSGRKIYYVLFRHFDDSSGETLWDVFYTPSEGTGEPEDIFYVQHRDGSFVEVGPVHQGPVHWGSTSLSVGPQTVAASSGMGHILFETQNEGLNLGEHWAGDTTLPSAESLYEYTGIEQHEPALVGVANQHRLLRDTEAELISQCGTSLGAGFGEKYNALAANGTRIFFTAHHENSGSCTGPVVNEVYARLNGERTVAISEPSTTDCAACNTSRAAQEAAPEGALFQGANSEGSKVFFLTDQELLPGAKGKNLYEYDFDASPGQRVTLISAGASEANALGVIRVSQDGSHTYFVAAAKLTGANAEGKEPTAEGDNLYVYEQDAEHPQGRLSFVGSLAGSDETDWEEPDFSRPVGATPNGQFLVFTSSADLTPDDTSTQRQVFEYDAKAQTLTRVSVGQRSRAFPAGYNENGNSTSEVDSATLATSFYSSFDSASGQVARSVSDDGHYVFFQSALGLAPEAADTSPGAAPALGAWKTPPVNAPMANGQSMLRTSTSIGGAAT